ncbi:LANO_0F03928g1_1 [Lachancea nothofagi CBS 11611]|uniref:LANO_0F03928g1_1 n=1 Tax=Lachancea nothofagi CBS 11611 TaxID=1266666 RepID=A0A1G4K7E4_9SACH|nr:LANO_0F03928g1_1 [Lachancea nothofagi CBS 11611]
MVQRIAKNKKPKRSAQFKFIKDLLLADFNNRDPKRKDQTAKDEKRETEVTEQKEAEEAEHEMEHILNMLRLFIHMEKLMLYSLLACLNCFLYYFTVFPARLLFGLFGRRKLTRNSKEYNMLGLIGLATMVLLRVDTSRVYHRIKGQSAIKLYMMFGVLEMCDKMLSSVGQSLMLVVRAKRYKKGQAKAFQTIMLNLCALAYLVCHGFILMYETIALNVAVNSYSNSLLTLLLSMQFAEIKASVFKRFDKEGLFQITISDIIERFQTFILLTIIAIRNLIATTTSFSTLIPDSWSWNSTSSTVVGILCGPVITVVGSEILVDWIKHAYIIKFNRVRPQMYDTFLQIICHDHTHNLQKLQVRLGLPIPALVVLFIVMIRPALEVGLLEVSTSMIGTVSIVTMGVVCLFLSKFVLHLALTKWSQALQAHGGPSSLVVNEDMYVPGLLPTGQGKIDEQARARLYGVDGRDGNDKKSMIPSSSNEKRAQHDSKRNLKSVTRYKMVSKRIW